MDKETLEEVAKNYESKNQHKRSVIDFIEGAKWMQEKMYSDIEQKWNDYRIITNNEDAWSFKEWLVEQFKKNNNE